MKPSLSVITALLIASLLPGCQSAGDSPRSRSARVTSATPNEVTVPTAREELKVGKRQVEEGTTRVQKRTVEKPVEEQVPLREEHIVVERRDTNRPIKDAAQAFEEKTIEMTETKEEPVIGKEARQTGEIVLKKQTEERTETIRDTIRETDVEVREGGQRETRDPNFASAESMFRRHYAANYKNVGSYDHYRPAYQYGYAVGQDPQYRNAKWSSIEEQVRRGWDDTNGSWAQHKDAVKYGWEQARQQRQGRG